MGYSRPTSTNLADFWTIQPYPVAFRVFFSIFTPLAEMNQVCWLIEIFDKGGFFTFQFYLSKSHFKHGFSTVDHPILTCFFLAYYPTAHVSQSRPYTSQWCKVEGPIEPRCCVRQGTAYHGKGMYVCMYVYIYTPAPSKGCQMVLLQGVNSPSLRV